MNLLIVDDEVVIIEGILKGVNWETLSFDNIFSAASMDEAKKIFEKKQIDIMLCDIEMPGGSGIDLLKWVRKNEYNTECIFLTCHDEFDYARSVIKLRGMDYLLKPIPYDKLHKILYDAIKNIKNKEKEKKYSKYGKDQLDKYKSNVDKKEKNSKIIVEKVKKYIQENIEKDLTAEILANEVYISVPYLFNIFKKEENTTIVEYITNIRIFYASEMLVKEKELSINRIALSVGYNNYCYFTKVFKKNMGVTPREYRKNHVKKMEP